MHLFYDDRDDASHEARGSRILYWLDDVGAKPLSEARADEEGFVFAGADDRNFSTVSRDMPISLVGG